MSKTKRVEGPFTTDYGTFNPGDKCIAITVCTGRVKVSRVEYVGYVEREVHNWQTRKNEMTKFAQIRRPTKTWTPFWEGTDEVARWPYGSREVEYRDVEKQIITTLQYNRLIPASATTDDLIKEI
jgi:hypothetical protein